MSIERIDKKIVDGRESIVIESTLPPTASRQMLANEGATVLVFSHDAGLAGVIRNVSADRYPFRVIDEWNTLLHSVGTGQGRIVLLDVDALSGDIEESLAELNRCSDWLVVVVAAKQNQAQDFMRFWSERRIHRLLIKPAAAGITRLLLESAFARFIELRELHENTDSMEIPPQLLAEEAETEQRRWLWPALAAAAAVVVAIGIWLIGFSPGASPVPPGPAVIDTPPTPQVRPQSAASEAESPQAEEPRVVEKEITPEATAAGSDDPAPDAFADLLARARAAEALGRFAEPVGDNAIDYYTQILTQAPNHVVARERLDVILEDLFVSAEEQLLDRNFEQASATLARIRRGNPRGSRLQFLSEQLEQMLAADAAQDTAQQQSAEAANESPGAAPAAGQQSELQSMLTLARLRLDQGALVEPAGDSARDYLLRAVDLGVAGEDLAGFSAEFAQQAIAEIPSALADGRVASADAMLRTSQALGSVPPDLANWSDEVAAAMAAAKRETDTTLHARALLRIDDEVYIGSEDSAVELLNELRSRESGTTLVTDLESRLTNALSRSIRQAIAAERWNEGDALLAAFELASLDAATLGDLERELNVARRQAEFLGQVVPIGQLTLLEARPAEYPRNARLGEITGWVELHFTVDTDGVTQDIEVVAAEPPNVFETVAIEALEQYRFEPFVVDARPYQRRARLRMRFELD